MRKAARMMLYFLGVAALIFVAIAGYIRFAADSAHIWHLDPEHATRTGKPNDFVVAPEGGDMVSPVYNMSPEALMARFRKVAMAQPRVTILGERDGFATFVQRSRIMAYPDYISVKAVKAVKAPGGAQLHVYSRARYGFSDMGVNKARVLDWLGKI